MLVFRLALLAGAAACLVVAAASWNAGYPPELALTRGVFAFVAMCVLGFVGQLTVARADGAAAAPPGVPTPGVPTPGVPTPPPPSANDPESAA